ncbi:hypothetical protein C5167_025781 [Papaver somniferum]|uniref:Uncharacterized protein n=1 Tax=Papaver somniferum TaxID=3469 RepID=A0A4Y7JWC0_PAPSO|nr:transcription elongation factor SPT5-like [Papaver somniferum]XP_026389772.1 transcription elongation factor SPT5-like [Papaver somniferum]RZC64019.1 hypothetical protein C5167_025781 [Papaver somniferum]
MKLRSDYVYEYRPTVEEEEEKELVARAVDAAKNVLRSVQSSYDVAAVTPGVDVDQLMPDAYKEEESLEPQRDDDICSTSSTIEYTYPEEEEPSKNSYGDDEDDKVDEEDNEEDEDDDEEDEDDDEEDEDDDNSSMFSDTDYGMIPEGKSLTDEDSESDSDNGNVSKSPVKQLSKDDWVASWNEGDPQEHLTWINVYAYYRKKEKGLGGYGGYGVILRYDDNAKPVAASAKYSADGKSFLYQVLMGIKAGVQLAEDHKLPGRSVRCNSVSVESLIRRAAYYCSNDECRNSYEHDKICRKCEAYLNWVVGCDMGLWPLVQDLKSQKELSLEKYPKACNEAAHYLAKMAKAKHEKKGKSIVQEDEDLGEIVPDKFPGKLIDILWADAFRGMSYYRASSVPW